MFSFDIYADSTCDLGREFREKYNIFYAPMSVSVDGVEYTADLDWKDFSPQQFYNWMREGKKTLTAQVFAHVYEELFRSSLEKGKDVLYLSCSSKLSGSVNIAMNVAEDLEKEFPGRKVICVDTLRATFAQGMIAIQASRLRSEGLSIEETAAWVDEHKLNFHEVCTVESLSYLRNAGRVKATSAFFGNILGVKPMIIADALGNNYALKKVKGRRTSLLEVINMISEDIIEPENQVICVEHADCDVDCEFVKQHIIDKFHPKDVIVGYVGPIIGSTVGPGSIIVSYYGEKETRKGE